MLYDRFGGDPDAKTSIGVSLHEAITLAQAWWDYVGRYIVRNPEFQDPEVGFKSGILRGLEFHQCSEDEQERIVRQYFEHTLKRRHQQQQAMSGILADSDAGRKKPNPQ